MQKSAWILAILTLFAQVAIAQSTVPHPRLMLDAATLTALRARAQANTPQWQALKSYCNSFIGGVVNYPDGATYPNAPDIGQGYEGDGYWAPLMSEGLCYQVMRGINATAAAPYGAKAADIAVKISVLFPALHSEDPCTDNGYVMRFYGVGMGILYDWAYDVLTPSQRTQIYTTANSWLNTWETSPCSNFEYAHPQSNYFAGYFHAKTVIALATAGENPSAPALWADWNNTQFNTAASNPPHIGVQPYYAAHMTGGGWPEGFGNYGPLATLNMSLPAWEVKTATGTDLIHAANMYTFPLDAADYLMHFTWPARNYIDDRDTDHANGDASAPPPGTASAGMFMQVLGTLRYWNAPHADVFQQYANEVIAATSNDADAWEAFTFYDPNGATAPVTDLGLSYFATGLNAVSARSDWSTSASWLSFRASAYANNPAQGEEGYDQGGLALVRGGTPLLVNGSGWIVHEPGGNEDENRLYTDLYGSTDGSIYSGNRTIYNIFYARAPGTGGYARYGQASYTLEDDNVQTKVASFEDGGTYVYALGTRLEDTYVPGPGSASPLVAGWSREIVYLRPSQVVVYDRSAIGATVTDQFLAFHFAANPAPGSAPSGAQRYDITYNATYAGAITTVLPVNPATTVIAMYPANDGVPASNAVKAWQLQIRSPAPSVNQLWLNVFDLVSTSSAVAAASKINVTTGAATGVLLASTGGNEAVLFNTRSAGTTIAGTISYAVPAAATTHYITEVPANTEYAVSASVSAGTHTMTVAPGSGLNSSANGVLTFTVSAAGIVGPADRIFANGFE